ncbi:hypothetical protein [Limosilactobacillus fermentum]|uniref:hypothetical protein n=1 Tax=Limosilactobacillus fermentum TaxID=1613 RepID=UPI00054DFD3A|nr:hypothetical protein [Limosilactobacillus fermentum]
MKQLDLKPIGLTDRAEYNATVANFAQIQAAYNDIQNQIAAVSDRLDKLDDEKATHDDVEDLRKEMYQIRDDWHNRASHIALGTDVETTKAVVEQILQEKGLI